MEIAYLGPEGTFTQQAALKYNPNVKTAAHPTIEDVIAAVDSGTAKLGIVPLENSIEGSVNITLDYLIFEAEVFIRAEIKLNISQNLMARKGFDGHPSVILSHPQGLAQCRRYLREHYPQAELAQVSSTAEAAGIVARSAGSEAAIANELAAGIYGLDIIERDIQDLKENVTTFVVLSKEGSTLPSMGRKMSVAFSLYNKPGELYKLLGIFSMWDINMSKILSRPMKNSPGEYVFFVDLDGFESEKDLSDALIMVKRKTRMLKVLGSYPSVY